MDKRRSRKKKKITYNTTWIGVGVGVVMLFFSAKLQSHGSMSIMASVNEVGIEVLDVESEPLILPILKESELKKYYVSFYQVPFGELPDAVQIYTHQVCGQYGIPVELVFAMMQVESKFDTNAVGDNGQSFGYMQVMEKWHKNRMTELEVTNLKKPEENILVAVDYLEELYLKYGNMTSALMAYNCGPRKANELWEQGIWQTEYTQTIMQHSKEIGSIIHDGDE